MTATKDDHPSRQLYMWAAGAAYFGSYAVGTAIGYSSPAQDEILEEFPDLDESLFGSMLTMGALVGGLVSGGLIEALGRKGTILGTSLTYIIGWTLLIFRSSPLELYTARFLVGSGVGIYCMVIPVYIGEISPPEKRGIVVSGNQFNAVVGILLAYVFGAFLNATVLAIICAIPIYMCVIAMFFVPESPTWLVRKKKTTEEVMKSLNFLYGHGVRAETQQHILLDAQNSEANSVSISDLFEAPVLKPLGLAFGLMVLQQGSGINAVLFYTESIFESAGTTIDPRVETIIVGSVFVIFTIPAALLMDRAGRRMLLHISGALALLGLALLVLFYEIKAHDPIAAASLGWLPPTALSVFTAGYALGLGPVPWLMMSELLPMRARGIGTGLCTAFSWSLAFIVTKFFPSLVSNIGAAGSYAIFGSITAAFLAFSIFFVPETKGKSLEEIETMFRKDTKQYPVNSVNSIVINF